MSAELTPKETTFRSEVTDDLAQKRELTRALDGVVSGRVNWIGEFWLSPGSSGTVDEDDRVTQDSQISLTPVNLAASTVAGRCYVAALRPGTPWAPNGIGEFLVIHPAVESGKNTAKFRYSVKG